MASGDPFSSSPFVVMEIDAVGTYTVSKTVYDLWMKVIGCYYVKLLSKDILVIKLCKSMLE